MSEVMQFTGKVHSVGEEQHFGQKGFKKREVVLLNEGGTYTKYLPFQCLRDDVDLLDGVKEGDIVKIDFELGGRSWRKHADDAPKYFLDAEVREITNVSAGLKDADDLAPEDDEGDEVPF